MDRENLLAAVRDVRADAVMHQLTALGTAIMRQAMQGTNALRTTGAAHLLAAARAAGARRFLTQSIVFARFTCLEDAAAATVGALAKGRAGQAYNIVDDEPARWAGYLDALVAGFGVRWPWRVPTWMPSPASAFTGAWLMVAGLIAATIAGTIASVQNYRTRLVTGG
jgi:nucleoside-diphosphate-sugar epimerase